MAVLVDFEVLGVTAEQIYAVEARTNERGEALGGPPYAGCIFLAVTAHDHGFRFVSAWRTEDAFRAVLDEMLGPDLAAVSAEASNISVSPVVGMAVPGAGSHGA